MTITIHRCQCGHKHLDHEREGARCSFGGCTCTQSADQVQAHGTEEQIPTFPGYNAATGKWARR